MIKPYTLCNVVAALLSTHANADEVKQPLPKSIENMMGDDTQRAIKRIAQIDLKRRPSRQERFVVDLMALVMDSDSAATIQEMAKVLRAR